MLLISHIYHFFFSLSLSWQSGFREPNNDLINNANSCHGFCRWHLICVEITSQSAIIKQLVPKLRKQPRFPLLPLIFCNKGKKKKMHRSRQCHSRLNQASRRDSPCMSVLGLKSYSLMTPYHFKPYLVCKSETKLFLCHPPLFFFFFGRVQFLDCIARDKDKGGYGDNFWGQWTVDFQRGGGCH